MGEVTHMHRLNREYIETESKRRMKEFLADAFGELKPGMLTDDMALSTRKFLDEMAINAYLVGRILRVLQGLVASGNHEQIINAMIEAGLKGDG